MDNQEQPLSLSDKDKEFAYQYLSDRENYHSNKETSAYTIFAAEVAFFTTLLTTDLFNKIVAKICYPKLVVSITVFLIWLLVHRFLRWQLINRRLAALQVATLITVLLDNLKTKDDGKANTSTSDKKVPKTANFFDRWIWPRPVPSATSESDVDLKDYPDWYQKRYIIHQEKGTGAVTGEWFPTIGSIVLLIISLLYVFFILV